MRYIIGYRANYNMKLRYFFCTFITLISLCQRINADGDKYFFFDTLKVNGVLGIPCDTHLHGLEDFTRASYANVLFETSKEHYKQYLDKLSNHSVNSTESIKNYLGYFPYKNIEEDLDLGVEVFTNIIRPDYGFGFFADIGIGYIHEVLCHVGIDTKRFKDKEYCYKDFTIDEMGRFEMKLSSNTIYLFIHPGIKFNFTRDIALGLGWRTYLLYKIASLGITEENAEKNLFSKNMKDLNGQEWRKKTVNEIPFGGGFFLCFELYNILLSAGINATAAGTGSGLDYGYRYKKKYEEVLYERDISLAVAKWIYTLGYDFANIIKDEDSTLDDDI